MSPEAQPARWTYQELRRLPEDGRRHELVRGEHLVTPAPSTQHQLVLMNLLRRLDAVVQEGRLGLLIPAPCDVVLSMSDVIQPDLIFVSIERAAIVEPDCVRGAPDLAVEVVLPESRRRDRETKPQLHRIHGTREVWIVDPAARSVEVLVRRGSELERVAQLSAGSGARLTSGLFPGLEIPLVELFTLPVP